ncbi:TLR adapter interacting with SLC15A4 on the lysosome [Lepisosteus oculatus]|uniref:TLR adaptor interacting with endolysosomal SLC15A4 n=1 Tax=Lepisosteus oculatus TaxID=7918 RepID=W5NMP6_LEPOC|nr:PREDICTED: uncharacterized protein CXorf21 homolog [Lepisosteus oculatus]XP_015219535.1 PREDICTED: uncharacterized protein CXorf21 homolog [Lepisosteus oculatus]XP_015219536.1 PREDICTED: uncharacterized protein CXorf21 homolog [Lepisosteus oculatus]XP_015219537.1 PREDICTED: uncharacterized protein CXorf21 homolog [Lepisosteus oculatus]
MLCESFLWAIPYGNDGDRDNQMPSKFEEVENYALSSVTSAINLTSNSPETELPNKPSKSKSMGRFIKKESSWNKSQSKKSEVQQCSRQISPVVHIPRQVTSSKEAYLVPSSCKSICKDYNDLQIAGDQVMPLSSSTVSFTLDSSVEFAEGPFLQSCEIPPAMETPRPSLEYVRKPIKADSSCWRVESVKEKSFLHHSRPLSNAMLNEYLEQKIMDLYKQYMVDSMLTSNSPTTILASELILTNVDQITQQISREQNMEAAKAKDMVISCLLRVASGIQSSELSTPQLQISSERSINR